MLVPCSKEALNIGLALILALCTASSVVHSAPTAPISKRAAEKCPYDYGRNSEGNLKQPSTLPPCLPSDPFTTYIKAETLGPAELAKPDGGRTIIIGDVHGHLDGLMGFLSKVEFDQTKDKIILAGDLVAKGPKSLQLLDKAQELGAECVRGNHDDEVLRWRGYLNVVRKTRAAQEDKVKVKNEVDDDATCEGDEDDQCEDEPEENDVNLGKSIPKDLIEGSEHHVLALKMTDAQYQYLLSCPLMLRIPDTVSKLKVAINVVHAGVDPALDFEKQQPWTMFNIRNILDGVPSRKKKGTSWSKTYNAAESKRVAKGAKGQLLIYGHDAGRGLNQQKWSIGLDTGCVQGGSLTGYIVEQNVLQSYKCPDVGNGGEDDD